LEGGTPQEKALDLHEADDAKEVEGLQVCPIRINDQGNGWL